MSRDDTQRPATTRGAASKPKPKPKPKKSPPARQRRPAPSQVARRSTGGGRLLRPDKSGRYRLGGRFVSEKKAKRHNAGVRGARTRKKNAHDAALLAQVATKEGSGTGSKTRLPPFALWPSVLGRRRQVPLLKGKPSAGEVVAVSAIVALDQSVETTSKGTDGAPLGRAWVSDSFFLGRMTIAEALSLDGESIKRRYEAAIGERRRGKAQRIVALVREKTAEERTRDDARKDRRARD